MILKKKSCNQKGRKYAEFMNIGPISLVIEYFQRNFVTTIFEFDLTICLPIEWMVLVVQHSCLHGELAQSSIPMDTSTL